jgi:hypothetical protein
MISSLSGYNAATIAKLFGGSDGAKSPGTTPITATAQNASSSSDYKIQAALSEIHSIVSAHIAATTPYQASGGGLGLTKIQDSGGGSGLTQIDASTAIKRYNETANSTGPDYYNLKNKTLAEVEANFYTKLNRTVQFYDLGSKDPSDYQTVTDASLVTRGMSKDSADAFLAAVKNKTLKFTSAADIPGLTWDMHMSYYEQADGNIVGSSSNVTLSGTGNISKALGTENYLIVDNGGYHDRGIGVGLIVSW